MKRIVIISDTQMPYEDKRALKGVIEFIGNHQPDEVVHIGDVMDFPTPSRWTKGSAEEFSGSVFKDSDYGKKNLLEPLRAIYDGPVKVLGSNHDERPALYLRKYAPALADSDAFDLPTLLDFDGFGVEFVPQFYDFAPGWTATHGHLGFSLSSIAGRTAARAASRIGKSVVMGHTHRLGIQPETQGYKGNVSVRWGFEVGNLMDIRKATYLKSGAGNWQQGFGVIYVDGSKVTPVAIPIHKDGTFHFGLMSEPPVEMAA